MMIVPMSEPLDLLNLSPHPAANLFPMLSDDELDALAADITERGLIEPVWLYDDAELGTVLLDGRNRVRACEMASVTVETRWYQGEDPIGFAIAQNVRRRHLTVTQLAGVAYAAKPLYEAQAKAQQVAAGLVHGRGQATKLVARGPQAMEDTEQSEPKAERAPLARDLAAASVGISGRTLGRYERVIDNAPDLADEVLGGELSLRRADEIIHDREVGAHVSNNSGDNEWYTPRDYIDAARLVMGAIDMDPASSAQANEIVGADTFYTKQDNGLTQPWKGRVWMNPPYAQPLITEFCARLAEMYSAGEVTEACVLVNNATETGWFNSLAEVATAICFPRGRVKFWHPDKKSAPLQGQAVLYLGQNVAEFRTTFASFGFTVML